MKSFFKSKKRRNPGNLNSVSKERAAGNQPYSPNTVEKIARTRGAVKTASVCPYCAVGCGQLIYTKGGKIIDIEGNPESPINEGTLCPRGANTFQLTINPHRQKTVMYRAPFATEWETRSLEWAMERIAEKVKKQRDQDFVEKKADGTTVNHLTTISTLGGATMDNEENYLIKKLFGGGLGVVAIENQARI